MKKRYYLLTAIFSYFFLLIASIPAKPVTDLINNNSPVTIQGVSGTLWNGKAYIISVDNKQFKKTEWSFKLWKLFFGKIALNINSHFLDNNIATELGITFTGSYYIKNMSAKITARQAAQLANIPLVQLGGTITANIKHAQWKQGEAPLASGEIKWHNATITVAETASLGNVSIILSESEQPSLYAEIKNQGGDITISGNAELLTETNYSVDIKLLPTPSASNNIKHSLSFFAQKQANGEYLLKKSGSLNQIM